MGQAGKKTETKATLFEIGQIQTDFLTYSVDIVATLCTSGAHSGKCIPWVDERKGSGSRPRHP